MAGFAPEVLSLLHGQGLGGPLGAGKVFFVDGTNGDDSASGQDPNKPLLTEAQAFLNCVSARNDYIVTLRHSTIPVPPLVLPTKSHIHLISITSGNFDTSNDLNGGVAVALRIPSGVLDFELAGFNIGGDGTNYAIEVEAGQTCYRNHIHHCTIGNNFGATDGIHANEISNSKIDHCLFGTAISANQIAINSSVMLEISDNLFFNIAAKAIYLTVGAVQNLILRNYFMSKVALTLGDGWAIDLPAGGLGSMIIANRAADCGDDTGNEPYVDRSGTNVGDLTNGWSENWGSEQSANGQIPPLHV